MDDREKFIRARQQVAAIKGVYIHLFIFVLVIGLLAVINLATSSRWWVQWPLLGWGIVVGIHAALVLGRLPNRVGGWVSNWEARKIRELKDKM